MGVMRKERFEEIYKERIGDKYDDRNFNSDDVYENYYSRVYPYLHVITDFKIKNPNVREEQIRFSLYISSSEWVAMKTCFDELTIALKSNVSLMNFNAQISLQKGLELKPDSAKLIELNMIRYDEEFKPKGKEVSVELPDIVIRYEDGSIDEKELEEEYDDKFEQKE